MKIIDIFESYAADFERTFDDDDWARLERYFTDDATYETFGALSSKHEGRTAVLGALRRNISGFDRRCDSRLLENTSGPDVSGRQLTREWRCTFELEACRI